MTRKSLVTPAAVPFENLHDSIRSKMNAFTCELFPSLREWSELQSRVHISNLSEEVSFICSIYAARCQIHTTKGRAYVQETLPSCLVQFSEQRKDPAVSHCLRPLDPAFLIIYVIHAARISQVFGGKRLFLEPNFLTLAIKKVKWSFGWDVELEIPSLWHSVTEWLCELNVFGQDWYE